MKGYMTALALTALALAVIGCEKSSGPDDEKQPKLDTNYVVFGHYHGYCVGEQCVEMFLMEEGEIYEDSLDLYPLGQEYSWEQLGGPTYQEARTLFGAVPQELLGSESQTFGIPDAYDQGGIYLEVFGEDGEKGQWFFDKNKEAVPEAYRPMLDTIEAIIERINR